MVRSLLYKGNIDMRDWKIPDWMHDNAVLMGFILGVVIFGLL